MISVIVPAYNAARTIGRCLESIFSQSLQNFEVIVVNDGSTDATLERLEFLQKRWPARLKVVIQKNRGAPAARNYGVRIAKGEYLIFCDADVVMRRDMLEKMLQVLYLHPEASYVYSSFKFGWKKFVLWDFDAQRLREMPYIHTTSLIRTEHFPGFDETVKRLQDWDLWLTMLEKKHTGVWIPEVLFKVVNTQGTMSAWLPSFAYKIPKWLGIHPRSVARYNEAVALIKAKHGLGN